MGVVDLELEGGGAGSAGNGESLSYRRAIQLLENALRLSTHVLQAEPEQLPGQLCGRLPPSVPGMDRVLAQLSTLSKPWLRLLTPSLESAGGALLRIFKAPHGVSGETDASQRPWAVTRDASRLIAGCGDDKIRVWDLRSGELLLTLDGGWPETPALALDPGGRTLVTSGDLGTLVRWDLETGRVLGASAAPEGLSEDELDALPAITAVSITDDGTRIFSGDSFGGFCVWDAMSLRPLRKFGEGTAGMTLLVLALPEGRGALSIREGNPGILVQRWDTDAGLELGNLRYSGDRAVVALALAPDGRKMAAYDDRIRIWDLGPGRKQPFAVERATPGFDVAEPVLSLAIAPDGRRLATGGVGGGGSGGSGIVRVWDLERGGLLWALEGHDDTVRALLWDSRGDLISASDDGTVKLWDPTMETGLSYGHGHASGVDTVAASPAGALAASSALNPATAEGEVRIWNLETGLDLTNLAFHGDPSRRLAFSPDGGLIALLADRFRFWDVASGLAAVELDASYASDFAFAFDRRWLAASSEDLGCLLVWDLETLAEPCVYKGADSVQMLAITPDNSAIAVLLERDPTPRVWDLAHGTVKATLRGHRGGSKMEESNGWASAVTMMPDSHRVAIASYEGTVGLWDLDTSHEAATFTLDGSWARSLAPTPDGTRLICGCDDDRVRIVDLPSRRMVCSLEGHRDRVNKVVVASDGRRAVSGASDGTIVVWDLHMRKEISRIECEFEVEDLSLGPDGRSVYVAGWARPVHAWDVASGRLVRSYEAPGGSRKVVATSDGLRLISAASDGTVRAWNVQTGALIWEIPGVKVGAITLSADGSRLFCGDREGKITVWDPLTGRETDGPPSIGSPEMMIVPATADEPAVTAKFDRWWTLRRGQDMVAIAPLLSEAVRDRIGSKAQWAAAPRGRRLVTSLGDRVTLWEGPDPLPLASLSVGGRVTSLAISPDGDSVIVGTWSGRVHLLRLEAWSGPPRGPLRS